MKKIILLVSLVLLWTTQAWAVPVLQVGVPDGSGGYVDYTTLGPDEETAFTSGNTLSVAGAYGPNVVLLGGESSIGQSWSDMGYAVFGNSGAVLVVTVPADQVGSISIAGATLILGASDTRYWSGNNHYPVNADNTKFWYFDIGNFADTKKAVPDFDSETGQADGEIKNLIISITGYSVAHFDVMALETSEVGNQRVTVVVENNPGSHDVTWISDDDDIDDFGEPVPEPGTFVLVGTGLVGFVLLRRKQK